MREFKFKVWDKKLKKMREDFCLKFYSNSKLLSENKDIIILQYTGLKDKNNKEIYEGDIIKDHHDNKNKIVVYKVNAGFVLDNGFKEDINLILNNKKYQLFESFTGIINPCKEYEIIGNIYENKELLKNE